MNKRARHDPAPESAPGGAPNESVRPVMGQEPGSGLPPELFRAVVEQAPVAVSITDAAANILYANRAFAEVTGYGRDEVLGHNESMLSDKTTPQEKYRELWSTITGNQAWSGQLVNRAKDGTRYLADVAISPVNDAQGRITHFLGMHRDVTEVRALAQQVNNQKALIESVVESAPVVIALLDGARRVVRSNHAYQALGELCDGEPAARLLEAVAGAGGRPVENGFRDVEVEFPVAGRRSLWFTCSAVTVVEADGAAESYFHAAEQRYLLLVANDISVQKEREEELRTTALRALTAEQELVHGLREALSGAVFQAEGPFNMISAAVGMLARRAHSWPGSEPLLEVLREANEEGRKVLTRLRASMPVAPQEAFAPFNLNQVLRDVLSLFTSRMLSEGVTVAWTPGDIPHGVGREGSIRGLFKQLIENALDAMAEQEGDQRLLTVTSGVDGDELTVDVGDSGGGVPEGCRLKIFEPFFTTKGPHGRGTGMGLAMVQEVVNEHAGTVALVASSPQGALFRVRLPIAPPIPEEAQ